MKVFVLSNRTDWRSRKILGLTPDSRLLFQLKAAGATSVTVLIRGDAPALNGPEGLAVEVRPAPDGMEDVLVAASALFDDASGPVAVFDSEAIFARDFAADALRVTENTTFLADGRAVVTVMTAPGSSKEVPLEGRAATITTPAGIKQAKKMLLNGLRKPMLIDGIVGYYIMRPITLRVTSLIVNTPIRPNHVTAFCMLLGLAGAAMVAIAGNREWMMALGVLLYFIGATLDCVDGEMARLKYAGSYVGAWFDTISDDFSTAALLIAIGFYATQIEGPQMIWLYMGLSAAVVFLLGEFYTYYYLAKVYHSGDVLDFQWAAGVKKKASADSFKDYFLLIGKRDFFSFALVILAVSGLIKVGLVWLSVMMYMFAVYVLVDIILSLRRPGWRTNSIGKDK